MDGFHSHPAVRPSVRQREAQTEMSEAPSSVQGICHAAWRGLLLQLKLKLHPRSWNAASTCGDTNGKTVNQSKVAAGTGSHTRHIGGGRRTGFRRRVPSGKGAVCMGTAGRQRPAGKGARLVRLSMPSICLVVPAGRQAATALPVAPASGLSNRTNQSCRPAERLTFFHCNLC
jgi:hypothetical protein